MPRKKPTKEIIILGTWIAEMTENRIKVRENGGRSEQVESLRDKFKRLSSL